MTPQNIGPGGSFASGDTTTDRPNKDHTSILDAAHREAPQKSSMNELAGPLTPKVALAGLGGFGTEMIERLVFELLNPNHADGNKVINIPALDFEVHPLDAVSPEIRRHLERAAAVFGDAYKFSALSRYPANGDAIALRALINHLYEQSEEFHDLIKNIGNADITALAGSWTGTATYAITTFFLDHPELYHRLFLVTVAPSSVISRREDPPRIPAPKARRDELLTRLPEVHDFGVVFMNSEAIDGEPVGAPDVVPDMRSSAKTAAEVIKRWLIDGSIYGSRSVNKNFDLMSVTAPFRNKIAIPALARMNGSAKESIYQLSQTALADGWRDPKSLVILGHFPDDAQWESGFFNELNARDLDGNVYNIAHPDPTLLGLFAVEPCNALNIVSHLR